MHREKTSYLAGIYTSREEFMPRWNSCIAKIMHRGNHASRVINYARREDFMPRQSYALREDFIPRMNICIAGRYSCPARGHTRIKKEQHLSIGLDCILLFIIKVDIKKEHRR